MRNAIWWLILAAVAAKGQFRKEEIGKDLGVVYAVRTADVNGDRKPDIVVITGSKAIWYENPTWVARTITENVAPKDHVSIAAHDIDGDGDLDFALAAEWQPRERATKGSLHWIEQLPNFQWRVHNVAKIPGAHRIRWADVDGDGKRELVVLPLEGKAWVYYLPGWRPEVAADGLELAHNFFLEEMADEAGVEILMASKNGVETLARQQNGTWTRTLTGEGQPGEVVVGRVNRYRVAATIEAFHGDNLVIYEEPRPRLNPQGASPAAGYRSALGTVWPRAYVDRQVYGGHALGFADFDGDGSDELAFGWRGKETGVGLMKRNAKGVWERTARLDDAGDVGGGFDDRGLEWRRAARGDRLREGDAECTDLLERGSGSVEAACGAGGGEEFDGGGDSTEWARQDEGDCLCGGRPEFSGVSGPETAGDLQGRRDHTRGGDGRGWGRG
jgi:hypothetical protein